jgi:hypothetical protein
MLRITQRVASYATHEMYAAAPAHGKGERERRAVASGRGPAVDQPSQASTLSWFSSIHFVAASSGDIPSSAM